MGKLNDLTGRVFGRLEVLSRAENIGKQTAWLCKCSCGSETIVTAGNLQNGHTQSCGCIQRETVGGVNRKHGLSNSRIYKIHAGIITRCYNEKSTRYPQYGGSGIAVCREWQGEGGAENFVAWAMKNGYADNLTIDRIDYMGNYEPSNCRWVDSKTQANNRRSNRMITYNGETHNVTEWAALLGMNKDTLSGRLNSQGLSVEEAFTKPIRKTNKNYLD